MLRTKTWLDSLVLDLPMYKTELQLIIYISLHADLITQILSELFQEISGQNGQNRLPYCLHEEGEVIVDAEHRPYRRQ